MAREKNGWGIVNSREFVVNNLLKCKGINKYRI